MSQPLLELGQEKVPEVQELGPIKRGTYESLGLSMLNTAVGSFSTGSRTGDLSLSLSLLFSFFSLPSNLKATE